MLKCIVLFLILMTNCNVIYGPYGYNNITQWNINTSNILNGWNNYFEIGGGEAIFKMFNFTLYESIILEFMPHEIVDNQYHLLDNESCLIEYGYGITTSWEILATYNQNDITSMTGIEQNVSISVFNGNLIDLRFRNNASHANRRCYFKGITLYGTKMIQTTTLLPTSNPSIVPTVLPTISPTALPTKDPTLYPTKNPSLHTTKNPTGYPSTNPSSPPTNTNNNNNNNDGNKGQIGIVSKESKLFFIIIGAAGACCCILMALMIFLFYQSTKYTKECETCKIDDTNIAKKVKKHLQTVQRVKSGESNHNCELEYINSDEQRKKPRITPFMDSDVALSYQINAMQNASYYLDENASQSGTNKQFAHNANITEVKIDSESLFGLNNINEINMNNYKSPTKDGPNGDHITDNIKHDDVIDIVRMYEENEANEVARKKSSLDTQAKLDSKFDNLLSQFDHQNKLLQDQIDKAMRDQIQYKD